MKRSICAVLAAMCCVGQLTAVAAGLERPQWAAPAMERWEACGKLEASIPTQQVVTRGELAGLLAQVGIAQSEEELANAATITREEAAVVVARVFGIDGAATPQYTDAAEIAPWAVAAVGVLQETGIMHGASGLFRPSAQITYAEAVVLLYNALEKTGTITGLAASPRHEAGVLAQGQATHVNDGKFEVTAVTPTEAGYRIELRGLAPLVGQQADAIAPGAPTKAGKWMGVQFKLSGLLTVNDVQFSRQGDDWTALGDNEAFAPAHQADSIMLYINGVTEASATAPEQERTVTLTLRNAYGGDAIALEIHFVPRA